MTTPDLPMPDAPVGSIRWEHDGQIITNVPTSYTGFHVTVPDGKDPRMWAWAQLTANVGAVLIALALTRGSAAKHPDATHHDVVVSQGSERWEFTIGEFIDWCWEDA